MGRRPVSRWVWLLGLVLLAAGRGAARADEATAWRDAKILEARLAEACDAIEKATGTPFAKRPTVKMSTTKDVVEILKVELAPQMKAMGEADALPGVLNLMAEGLVGKYDPATGIVHLVPSAVEKLAEVLKEPGLLEEDTLRVVLAHECTHAHDFGIYDWVKMSVERTTVESHKALNAIIEGHAQLVAEEIAATWGLSDAFRRFTRTITAVPPIEDATLKQIVSVLAAEMGFAYVQGHAFLKAVKAAQGLEGVERVLRAPPESTRSIERPESFIDPRAAAKGVDLAALLETMRPLVGDPAWHVRTDRILEATLESLRPSLPEARRAGFLHGYADGRMLVGTVTGEQAQVILVALAFATADDVKAHLDLERDASKQKDEAMKKGGGMIHILASTYEEGVGPGASLPGFRVAKSLEVFGNAQTVETATVGLDRIVVQLVAANAPGIDHAAQDEALARAAAYVEDPAAAMALPPLATRPFQKTTFTLTLRVLDGDGKPVPKAKAMIVGGGQAIGAESGASSTRAITSTQSEDVEDGKAVFAPVRGDVTVEVWGAAAADGSPLPWAPFRREKVAKDAGEVEVRLEPGAAISGHVRSPEGKGVAGLEVEALAHREDWPPHHDAYAAVKTDAEGAFRLVGLARGGYRVKVESSGAWAAPRPVEAKGGDEAVEIVVKPGVTVTLTVVDWNGAPAEGARVVVPTDPYSWGFDRDLHGDADAAGHVSLAGLDPTAKYFLRVLPPVGRTDLVRWGEGPEESKPWKPADGTLTLARGFAIHGMVRDAKGAPVRASIWLVRGSGSTISRDNEADGSFTLTEVPYGPAKIGAASPLDGPGRAPGPRPRPKTWVTVTPEKPEASLVAEDAVDGRIPFEEPKPIEIRIENGATPNRPNGRDLVLIPEGPEAIATIKTSTDAEGVASLQANEFDASATYTLWIPPDASAASDLCLWQPGFKVASTGVTVTLKPGLTVHGRLTGIAKATNVDVAVLGPADTVIPGRVTESGEYEVRGLPPGTWKLKAKARGETAYVYATADVEAGATLDLELKPK